MNVNSIRNKVDMLFSMVKDNIDILMVSETILDSSFPQGQFRIEGYASPHRYDRNSHGGGINKLHERALRLVCDNRQLTFEELLNIDKSVTIHHKNLQVLATELYKVHHGLVPEHMNNMFKKRNVTYDFRKISTFETRNIKSVY